MREKERERDRKREERERERERREREAVDCDYSEQHEPTRIKRDVILSIPREVVVQQLQ